MNRKGIAIILSIIMTLTLFPSAAVAKDNPQNQQAANGVICVSLLQGDQWLEVGNLPYDRFYSEQHLDVSTFITTTGAVTLKFTQKGGGSAQLDCVTLGENLPITIENPFELKKVMKRDYDVISFDQNGIEVSINANVDNPILHVTARIESEIISQTPIQFPLENNLQPIDNNAAFYTYGLNSNEFTPNADNMLLNYQDQKPFMKEFCLPGSGHPAGDIYGWVSNDAQNLYVALDVTSDNTMDGVKDYAKVNIKTATGVKVFKVSVPETDWGKASFVYTNKVAYQHKTYEFIIPLS